VPRGTFLFRCRRSRIAAEVATFSDWIFNERKNMTKKGLYQVEDFETPTRKPELVAEEPKIEAAVRKGFALATFVKVIFERNKDDVAFASLEISLPLTEEHAAWLPDELVEAWQVVKDHSYKVQDINVEPHIAEIQLAPDAKDGAIKIDNAEVEKASISVITEKGTGEEREITRLTFRLKTELDNEIGRFSRVHFGHTVWLKLQRLQGRLIK
jgi:hypothetical protein